MFACSQSITSRLAARNAHEERSLRCSHRRLTTGATGGEATRGPGGLGTTERKTGARLRSARDSTGEKCTGAVGARDVSGEAWRESSAHPWALSQLLLRG